jgi:hypothetical protein
MILNGDQNIYSDLDLEKEKDAHFNTFILLFTQHSGQSNQVKEKIKDIQNGKNVNLSLFADDTILHRKKTIPQ